MSWAALTTTQAIDEGAFSEDEKATLDAATGTGADLTNVLANVIATVRGTIQAAGMELGTTATIPDSLRKDVVALVRWAWLTGFPQLTQLQTEARKEAADRAEDRLDAIAEGTRKVETPDGTSNAASPSIANIDGDDPAGRNFTQGTEDGL